VICLWLRVWRTSLVTRPYLLMSRFVWVTTHISNWVFINYRRLSTRVGLRHLWMVGSCPVWQEDGERRGRERGNQHLPRLTLSSGYTPDCSCVVFCFVICYMLEVGNNLSSCNVVFSMNISCFYFPQWWCLICQWNACCDDAVSISRRHSITLIMDYFNYRL